MPKLVTLIEQSHLRKIHKTTGSNHFSLPFNDTNVLSFDF